MLDLVINVALLIFGVVVLVAYVPVMWWCWTQVLEPNPAWTDGLPRWLKRRLLLRQARRSRPAIECGSVVERSEQLALPPAPSKDAA